MVRKMPLLEIIKRYTKHLIAVCLSKIDPRDFIELSVVQPVLNNYFTKYYDILYAVYDFWLFYFVFFQSFIFVFALGFVCFLFFCLFVFVRVFVCGGFVCSFVCGFLNE